MTVKKRPSKSAKPSEALLSETKVFEWTPQRSAVAVHLAQGYTWKETAKACQVSEPTISAWKKHADFAAEVDRLSLMVDIAGRAERLRIAMQIVRKKGLKTERDLLEWLKFAQSETDGVKLDLTALLTAAAPVADPGPAGSAEAPGAAADGTA